jgi:hypothetical protein
MSYSIDVFSQWSTHTSWDSLKQWLTSPQGGNLRVVDPLDKSPYAIIRYVKEHSDFNQPHVPWCRSVIIKKDGCRIVCVAPPKASKFSESDLDTVIVAEEFIDGTMINIFKENAEANPVITTRSRVGGESRFYDGGLTFGQMLKDAVENINDILPSSENPTFVSVVLQHPKNRIVKHIEKPMYYIVHKGSVNTDGTITISETTDAIQKYNLNAIRGAKNVEAWVTQQSQERGFGWQGLVLKDGNGKRWRIRSQVYETVRRIRGNESGSSERFARLRLANSVDQYVVFYPEDRETFYNLEGNLRKNTRQLLHFYKETFRTHKIQYKQLPWPYKHHVSVLHNLYKDMLRAKNESIDLAVVIRYVNGLSVDDLINMTKVHNITLKTDPVDPPETNGATVVNEATVNAEAV